MFPKSENRIPELDDWGLGEIIAADSRDILGLIDDSGSTILVAQIQCRTGMLFSDPTLADACLGRLVHNVYRIELKVLRHRMMTNPNELQNKKD